MLDDLLSPRVMLRDYRPNEPELVGLIASLRRRLVEIVNGGQEYAAGRADLASLRPREAHH